jgi:hypothetical protein
MSVVRRRSCSEGKKMFLRGPRTEVGLVYIRANDFRRSENEPGGTGLQDRGTASGLARIDAVTESFRV